MNTNEIKAALKSLTGTEVKVRKGTGSHRGSVLVYLPKAVRTDTAMMLQVDAVCVRFGFIAIRAAFSTPGPLRPYYSVNPLFEAQAD